MDPPRVDLDALRASASARAAAHRPAGTQGAANGAANWRACRSLQAFVLDVEAVTRTKLLEMAQRALLLRGHERVWRTTSTIVPPIDDLSTVPPNTGSADRRLIAPRGGQAGPTDTTRPVVGAGVRHNRAVRIERSRENLFTVTATGQELSALIAGARLALDAMRNSPDAPATAVELLERVLGDFDRARERLSEPPPNGDRR
jgi:hypothetical protein